MKKTLFVFILLAFFSQTAIAHADKSQAAFSIQKARTLIEKIKIRGEEIKAPTDELEKAKKHLDQAEAILKKNTSLLGSLKKEAEPEIQYYVEMAEINAAIVFSRLEKIGQEKENARLEKLIPDLESKIKVFADKNAEIKRLKEELSQPRKDISSKSSEIALLKKEKAGLAEQVSKLKTEKENLNGKLEALNGVVASVRKDLSDKIKAAEDLTLENKRLKSNLQEDVVALGSKVQSLNRRIEYVKALGKFNCLSKISEKGYTLILPRKDLIKTTAKGPVLAGGGEQLAAKLAEFVKAFPESKIAVDVHGAGTPARNEDRKATESMAGLLKKAFVKDGVSESVITATGSGSGELIYSKGAVEENRRVEITFHE